VLSRKNAGEEDSEALREQFLLGHTQQETLEMQVFFFFFNLFIDLR